MAQGNAKGGGPPTGVASGDLSNVYPNPVVSGIQTQPVSNATPTTSQLLFFSGAVWVPTSITGDITPSLSTIGQLTVSALQGFPVSNTTPSIGNVLQWGGSSWTPGNVSGVTWANDLSSSNNTHQYISSISGTSGSGGSVALNITSLSFASGQSTPALNQTALGSTSSGSGSAGQDLTFTSQAGQAATGASHNGGNGGNLILSSGAGGTSGSATPGTAGNLLLQTGGTTQVTVSTTGVQMAAYGAGIAHFDGSGNITSSTIVNADVSGSAAIAYSKLNLSGSIVNVDVSSSAAIAVSKLAAGSAGQVLLNNATPAPTWTTVGGDAVISSSGSVTVQGLGGVSLPAPSGTNTYLKYSGSALSWATVTSGGGLTAPVTATIVTKTTTYTITTSDYILLCDTSGAAWTLTLPAPAAGSVYVVKDSTGSFETNNLTLAPHSTEKIEGVAASRVLSTNWGKWTFTSNGTDWFIVG